MSEAPGFDPDMNIAEHHSTAVGLMHLTTEQKIELERDYAPKHKNYEEAAREYLRVYGPEICGIK